MYIHMYIYMYIGIFYIFIRMHICILKCISDPVALQKPTTPDCLCVCVLECLCVCVCECVRAGVCVHILLSVYPYMLAFAA